LGRWKGEKGEVFEKRGGDPLSYIFWGLLIMVFGATLYLERIGYIKSWWWFFVAGVGGIFLLDALIRSRLPRYHRPVKGRALFGLFLILIASFFIAWEEIGWPLILILMGIFIVIHGLFKMRRRPGIGGGREGSFSGSGS